MPVLDQVKQMQKQGLNEEQITQKLKEQGTSPLEINQALEQAKIKAAVSEAPPQVPAGMQASGQQMPPAQPMTQEMAPEAEQMPQAPQAEPAEGTPEYIPPTPQAYPPEYQEYQPYQAMEPGTMTEIAEQITEEKLSKIKSELGGLSQLKTTLNKKVEDIDQRLIKIENTIATLQQSILGKIGEYGQSMEDIKSEMGMMQESFSKALNPLIDKTRETRPETKSAAKRKPKRKSDGFESYLRK